MKRQEFIIGKGGSSLYPRPVLHRATGKRVAWLMQCDGVGAGWFYMACGKAKWNGRYRTMKAAVLAFGDARDLCG